MAEDSHFLGKEPLQHVAEKLAEGRLSSFEVHGTELPGHLSAGTDAAREMAVVLLLISCFVLPLRITHEHLTLILFIFSTGWILWKLGRSAWLGWSRLERLHRVVKQEKWEIDHNRDQEKAELRELYEAKGFEGKLLDHIVDVLMADGDRLLKVMVEEELGLKLDSHEHPLKQAVGAGLGALLVAGFILLCHFFFPPYGIIIGAFISVGLASALSAYYEQNRIIPAVIWNVGLSILAFAWIYFLNEFFFQNLR